MALAMFLLLFQLFQHLPVLARSTDEWHHPQAVETTKKSSGWHQTTTKSLGWHRPQTMETMYTLSSPYTRPPPYH
ncbi:hypothetical protein Sjap_022347 [Stephania japonica]|uniref:Secreted protein n=1 Tax=Stephania japonica TaxID=461633 RepID=A0AAP0ENR2_9MAGN